MKLKSFLLSILLLSALSITTRAQKTEITISFSEQFFDALLDAVFQYTEPPEFSLAEHKVRSEDPSFILASFSASAAPCNESIKVLRENAGTRTSVRFRNGKIVAPLAFTGNYNPPLIGCVPFAGTAQTNIELDFDQANQRLIARAKVNDISLNGTGGIGGSLIARMVQGTIDKKINPIEIIRTDKVSFMLPLQNSNSVRMRATGFTHDVAGGQLNVHVAYEFQKAN